MRRFKAIGMMSGTSLDGVDLAYVQFENVEEKWSFEFLETNTIEYETTWKKKLARAHTISASEFARLDVFYGVFIGELINEFCQQKGIDKSEVDLIASHGHTIFHEPSNQFNFQIGSGAAIAGTTNIKTVCDFRTLDVIRGGQGAPLVPIGDKYLFNDKHYCINLGGFSNISIKQEDGSLKAFDICPVNMALNKYVRKLGKEYDNKGLIASSGSLSKKLLKELNKLEYYALPSPKSLGIEWFENQFYPLCQSHALKVEDTLRTIVEHIAIQITNTLKEDCKPEDIIFTGGGAYNQFLMMRIQEILGFEIQPVPEDLINYKEALIFAYLGVLREMETENILKTVTGAAQNSISGAIYIP